ncbi:hypothetical protein ACHAXR_013411 [Thalassiosira sp. AJA248-18]
MEDHGRITFVSNRHHPSDSALTSHAGGVAGGMPLLLPSSPLQPPNPSASSLPLSTLNLSTYTAGEDGGRLAMMAKEFGLARTRPPKPQVRRKHAFKAFLRNHPNNLSEDIPRQLSHDNFECRADNIPQSNEPKTEMVPSSKSPPLRFVFSGYSLWLELEQKEIDSNGQGDLDRAMIDAADQFSLGGAIPSPHVTALYGINTIAEEEEMRRMFRENVKQVLLDEAEKRQGRDRADHVGKLWPDLAATGIIVGTEFDGVNGGTMDMAWAEVSLATSPEHEALINALYEIFYRCSSATADPASSSSSDEEKKVEFEPRSNPWVPHLSLCYDNPEGFGPNLTRSSIENFMRDKCPTLEKVLDGSDGDVKFTVSGISLWRTAGTMDEWKCLDRLEFPSAE